MTGDNTIKHCLILAGGWDGHEPHQCSAVVADALRAESFEVTISDTLDALLDGELASKYSLIVPAWTMGEISPEQSKALREAVAAGVGLGGWHGGMGDAFRADCEYQFMTGGQFVCHPGGIIKYRVDIIDTDDPITRGIDSFEVESEQYYMHVDPSNNVLATTTFSGEHAGVSWIKGTVMPVVWKRTYGKGKVFFCSLGHVASEFDNPNILEITKRGLLWAAR